MTSIYAGTRMAKWVVEIAMANPQGFSMGGAEGVLYIAFPEGVVAVTTPRVPLMPNGIVLPQHAWPDQTTATGSEATLGPRLLQLDGRDIVLIPSTTYDLAISDPASPGELTARVREAGTFLDGMVSSTANAELETLAVALAQNDTHEVADTARALIGRGGGLTPEGDDLVVGAAAACHALGMPSRVIDALVPSDVGSRTTALSATLLRHARAGRVVAPSVNILSRPAQATRDIHMLLRVGNSTGRAYLRAVRAVVESFTATRSDDGRSSIKERK